MEVTRTEFHTHIRENDAAFGSLATRITVIETMLTEVRGDVKSLLHNPTRGNGNPPRTDAHQRLQYDLIRLLAGALLALAGVGAQRFLAG